MSLETFLTAVLPSSGTYFVGTKAEPEDSRFRNWGVNSIPALVREIRKQGVRPVNVWFGVSSFKNKSKRTADNAVSRKAMVFDIDCGEDKAFKDKTAGVAAYYAFIKASSLPPPTHVTDSGHGIHPWWAFTEDIDAERWLHTAQLLKELCALLDFEVDPTVTADLARIMRAPETTNYKPGMPAVDTGFIHEGDVLLDFLDFHNRVMNALETHKTVADNSDLTAGIDAEDFPEQEYSAKLMLGDCEILRGMHETGGEHVSELHWMQALLLLAYCKDGEEYIHAIGDKHPTYTKKKTVRKFNIQQAKKQRGKGKPILCKTLAPCAPALCAKCRHNGKIKTPLMCGRERNSVLPEPYFDGVKGTFRTVVGGEHDGEVRFVAPLKFTAAMMCTDDGTQFVRMSYRLLPSGREKEIDLPTKEMSELRSFTTSSSDMILKPKERKEVHEMVTSWAQQLEDAGNVVALSSKFGWVDKGKDHGFSVGSSTFWADGSTTRARLRDTVLNDTYTPRGDPAVWLELASKITGQDNPAADMVLAASFAAPLMSLTGDSGAVLSLTSTASGTGKTTILRLAQAVWGNPRTGLNALDDTPASLMNKVGVLNNLPMLWDEVRTPKNVESLIKFIFRMGQGKDKARLTRSAEAMDANSWDTLMVCASNVPLRDHMVAHSDASDAGPKRIFEIEQPKVRKRDINVPALVSKLNANYGHAGVEYAKWLATNRDTVEHTIAQVSKIFTARLKPDVSERFWLSMAVSTVTAAGITNKMGLTAIHMARLMEFVISAIEVMRGHEVEGPEGSANVTAASLIIRFMGAYGRNTIVSKRLSSRTHRQINPAQIPSDGFAAHVHYAKEDAVIRIDAAEFDRWAYDTYGSTTPQVAMLMDAGVVKRKCKFGAGAVNTAHRIRTYEVPLDKPAFADVGVT